MTVALFFSGIALRTRSLWPGALVHGLWDFLNIAPEMIFTTKYSIDYTAVGSHDEAMTLVVFYVVLIVLQSPLMLRGICMVREAEVPFFGWLPPQMPKGARRPRRGDVAPVPASAVAPDAAPGAPVAPGAKHIVSGEDGPLGAPDDASRGDIR